DRCDNAGTSIGCRLARYGSRFAGVRNWCRGLAARRRWRPASRAPPAVVELRDVDQHRGAERQKYSDLDPDRGQLHAVVGQLRVPVLLGVVEERLARLAVDGLQHVVVVQPHSIGPLEPERSVVDLHPGSPQAAVRASQRLRVGIDVQVSTLAGVGERVVVAVGRVPVRDEQAFLVRVVVHEVRLGVGVAEVVRPRLEVLVVRHVRPVPGDVVVRMLGRDGRPDPRPTAGGPATDVGLRVVGEATGDRDVVDEDARWQRRVLTLHRGVHRVREPEADVLAGERRQAERRRGPVTYSVDPVELLGNAARDRLIRPAAGGYLHEGVVAWIVATLFDVPPGVEGEFGVGRNVGHRPGESVLAAVAGPAVPLERPGGRSPEIVVHVLEPEVDDDRLRLLAVVFLWSEHDELLLPRLNELVVEPAQLELVPGAEITTALADALVLLGAEPALCHQRPVLVVVVAAGEHVVVVRQAEVVGELVVEDAPATVLRLDRVVADPDAAIANLVATERVEVRTHGAV